jgi:hypothetical protein
MARNVYFSHGTKNEQFLVEDLIVESLSIYGQEFYYIPRTLVGKDEILGEDRLSEFKSAYPIEMYMENVTGFEGQGAFIQKFGLMMEQTATLTVARRRWEQLIGRFGQTILPNRPCEGDLLYFPLSKGLFEIKFVKHQDPFYQLGRLYVYTLEVELFQYSSEHMDTGVKDIDVFETLKSFDTDIPRTGAAKVTSVNLTNMGLGYLTVPTVSFSTNYGVGAAATAIIYKGDDNDDCYMEIDYGKVSEIIVTNGGSGYSNTPTVTISAPTPQDLATGQAIIGSIITGGSVTGFTIQNPGKFYGTAPTITIAAPASGVRATATAVLVNGVITGLTITNPGSGYTVAPAVSIPAPLGIRATAEAVIEINIDRIDSYGDNNKFKDESTTVVFNANNPFGDIVTGDYPDLYDSETTRINSTTKTNG